MSQRRKRKMTKTKTFNDLTIQELKDRVAKYDSKIEKAEIKFKEHKKRCDKMMSDLKSMHFARMMYLHRIQNIERYEQPPEPKERKGDVVV